jgi:hypothetical protein
MVHLNLTKKLYGATQKQNDAAPATFEYEILFTFDFLKPWLDYYSSFLCVFIHLVLASRINAQIDLCFMDCIDAQNLNIYLLHQVNCVTYSLSSQLPSQITVLLECPCS